MQPKSRITHLDVIYSMVPKTCQIVLFSATFADNVRVFANKFAPSANEIRLKQEELSVEGIRQFYMDCKSEQAKYEVLVQLYSLLTIGQSIIFCKVWALFTWYALLLLIVLLSNQRRETADAISRRMMAEGHQVCSLHGAKDAVERDQVIDNFRDGKYKVLITTNVIARGIDILQVNMVVNYDLPMTQDNRPDPETYLHRIGNVLLKDVAFILYSFMLPLGRTGRFGRRGVSINFVHDERTWKDMKAIETALKKECIRVETEDYDQMEKARSCFFPVLFSMQYWYQMIPTGYQEIP